ncbi:MAG: acetyl/propionyl/methylcrotonyl-CoA carboxylase subunit alpha [Alphaproteobacteria bacterium]|nr:acetyl/propionyl/methylcrotonyl-CoA carboxylase subunit alpha [Alphaproteobacteria bacterium]
MIKKILIANRGEIACRVIKTARKMGISTVAIYSDADRNALHRLMADESVYIGPAPSAESYLVIDNILAAIKETGADAVHPGYGFLSENAAFAKALDKEGVTFIGPPVGAITAMGDKIASKKLAAKANVSTVPGHTEAVRDPDDAVRIANDIGYPVMLKASAGGGGKGMRLARNDEECRDGLERAVNEAKSSFGDDRVFVEKYIEEPRHIEIQIIADKHGNTVYMGERECSIQRRHQKVLEEAPSPFLDEAMRQAMGKEAVALAKAVDYHSAGTVEFIVDDKKNFFFLEMNTRLQVEHPVTELITGQDLVELMIKVAAGEELPFGQDDVKLNGWALEARVYAEDPFRNFLPSIGRLVRYQSPKETHHVRVDTGVTEGGEISMYYDPMIAKLITFGADRAEAIQHMRSALDSYYIRGVNHNIGFLSALIAHSRFQSGNITTNFIAEEYPDGFHPQDLPAEDPIIQVIVAASIHHAYQQRAASISGQVAGHGRQVDDTWVVVTRDGHQPVTIRKVTDGYSVIVDGTTHEFQTDWQLGEPLLRGNLVGDKTLVIQVERENIAYRLTHGGSQDDVLVLSPAHAELNALMPVKEPPDTSKLLLSPMPGLLISLAVAEGQEVKAGEELAVIEAMKMENVLRAERDAVVSSIKAATGESLMVDQVIMEFA